MNILGLTIILPSGTVIVNRILMAIITIFGVMMNKKIIRKSKRNVIIYLLLTLIVFISYEIAVYSGQVQVKFIERVYSIILCLGAIVELIDCMSTPNDKYNEQKVNLEMDGEKHEIVINEEKMFNDNLEMAKKGEGFACLNLSYFYRDGRGCPRSYVQSIRWAKKAMELDNPIFQEEGRKSIRDTERAARESRESLPEDILDIIKDVLGA